MTKAPKSMSIGERIQRAREAQSMSRSELAAHLGVSQATINAWETGRISPRPESMQKMAQRFGVDIEWLSLGEDIRGLGDLVMLDPDAFVEMMEIVTNARYKGDRE